jgi:hypothetical protein
MPGTVGEAGQNQQWRVRVVAQLRIMLGALLGVVLGLYYVSRTTHDVVVSQLASLCKHFFVGSISPSFAQIDLSLYE